MNNNVNILCSTDDNYVPYCGIMLTSLFESNKDVSFNVFILIKELTSQHINILNDLCNKYDSTANFISIKDMDIEDVLASTLSNADRLSLATYYRLFVAGLLPADVERVLYLDCDICVAGSIKAIYHENLEDVAMLAVADQDYFCKEEYGSRLDMPEKYTYVNAGMLVINLTFWRNHNLEKKFIAYISQYGENLLCHDQDVLNATLYSHIRLLPIKYNFQTGFLYCVNTTNYEDSFNDEIQKTIIDKPIVIHYTGYPKPWFRDSKHPYTTIYRHFQDISYWKDSNSKKSFIMDIYNAIQPKNILTFMKKLAINIAWMLRIKKRIRTYIIPVQKVI